MEKKEIVYESLRIKDKEKGRDIWQEEENKKN